MTQYDQLIDRLIDLAIEEDIATGDVTTNSIIPAHSRAVAEMKMKADGVISGLAIAKRVYEKFEKDILWDAKVKDGDRVKKGDIILAYRSQLPLPLIRRKAFAEHLATHVGHRYGNGQIRRRISRYSHPITGHPENSSGLRVLDKMAVKDGGATNHRMGLYDMAMIKDNHIKVAGGITNAVNAVRAHIPAGIKIEVETTNLAEVREALATHADIIMLDNMSNAEMAEAVKIIHGQAKTEASGNMSIPRLKEVAATGVDFISVGALTHSVTALDISMNIQKN